MSNSKNISNKRHPFYFGSVLADKKINLDQIFALLKIKEGEIFTIKEAEKLIKKWKKLVQKKFNAKSVEINAIIWSDNKRYIDMAIKIKGNGEPRFKQPPAGVPRLPQNVLKIFKEYQNRVNELLKIDVKKTTRYPSAGRWQSKDKILKKLDSQLLKLTPPKIKSIINVLNHHKNPRKRILALQLLNWAPPTPCTLDEIIDCLNDAAHSVHNEAASIALPKILILKGKSSIKDISKMFDHFNLLCRGKAAYVIYVLMKNKIKIPQSTIKKINKMEKLKSPFLKFYPAKIKKIMSNKEA